ncbi:MAG: beta-galactosidase [Pseudomonadota bacterium]|nr:beta-galactosidase [Pseudomonadota bacterium]MEC8262822.1 beta-galactosidase [Pseudomonadota bacterium]
MSRRKLGVCYFPEHWDPAEWGEDARMMAGIGIDFARIGEFAWGVIEPESGRIELDWMQDSLDLLHANGIEVILCTPTATPPKWLVDSMPDMLATDRDGATRGFGSRRHYSFAHEGYRRECARITRIIAGRFGTHPAVTGWQTDNEYGCHDTTISYGPVDRVAFRDWLAQRYQSVDRLNRAWGNVFWSMQYGSFDEVELPNLTVTEANPAHWMDYRRFASDMVAEFNRLQVEILRELSPGRDVTHNFMGRILDFDHFKLGGQIDVSTWDSYPLGFLDEQRDIFDKPHRTMFARAGDPDLQAFHHDLYRATSNGRWWVMEQQPGPVNWAPNNIAPRDGMIGLWALEAYAHGAEAVSYFRWRQAPFGQEQMHAGLLRPDRSPAEAFDEARQVAERLPKIDWPAPQAAPVALVFDYESCWAWAIQPQGELFDYFSLAFEIYRGLRRLGQSVDILSPDQAAARLDDYSIVMVPGLFACPPALASAMVTTSARVIFGPRSASKTEAFQIPPDLPPDLPADIMPGRVTRVETLAEGLTVPLSTSGHFHIWREFVEADVAAEIRFETADGFPAMIRRGSVDYLCGWPDGTCLETILSGACSGAGLRLHSLPEGVRLRQVGDTGFLVNYSDEPFEIASLGKDISITNGPAVLPPSGFAVVRFTG